MTRRMRHLDEKWHRLIPSRFPTVDVFERLGSPELAARAKELEVKSNPRLREKTVLQGSNPDIGDGSPQLQNWNHAPFAYANPEGSTFLHAGFRVLELIQGIRPAGYDCRHNWPVMLLNVVGGAGGGLGLGFGNHRGLL